MNKEFIICAAVCCIPPKHLKMKVNKEGFKVWHGHRHIHALEAAYGELGWQLTRRQISKLPIAQGFVTSKGRYVARTEAAKIAKKSKQIFEDLDILTSEDIY